LHKNFIVNVADSYVAKSPKSEILQFAIEDLKYATENIPDSWTGNDKGLPEKAAAAGLLARAYLYANDYPNAEIAAKNALDIADASGYGLMDNYTDMISEQPNKELLFTMNFLPNDATLTVSNRMTVTRICRDAPYFIQDEFMGRGWGYAIPSRDLYDAFEPGDPRRKASMWAPGDFYCIHHGTKQVYTNTNVTPNVTTTYNDGDTIFYQAGWSVSNLNTRKVVHSILGLSDVSQDGYNIPILRYAELYLYYAEALIENNKLSEGMIQINKVRARPSVNMPPLTATDQADARIKLRHERRIELNMEGIRLFDLMRWGILKDVFGEGPNTHKVLEVWGNSTIYKGTNFQSPKNNLWPIPQTEMDINKLMEQNPGY
jgi:starch-binding outer membrane protein, SusD/RagB family